MAQQGVSAGAGASAGASAKMRAILQQKTSFGYDLQNAQAMAAQGMQTAMGLQGSLYQQQQQMLMAQHMAQAQQQHVQMLQQRMAALDLVQKRVAAGSELQNMMRQFQQIQLVDQALDLRRTAETGVEAELIKRASAVDSFMRDASSTIMRLMAGNATDTSNSTYLTSQPETEALKLLEEARSFEKKAQEQRNKAREVFYKQMQLPLGVAAPAPPAAAGAEAAKAA